MPPSKVSSVFKCFPIIFPRLSTMFYNKILKKGPQNIKFMLDWKYLWIHLLKLEDSYSRIKWRLYWQWFCQNCFLRLPGSVKRYSFVIYHETIIRTGGTCKKIFKFGFYERTNIRWKKFCIYICRNSSYHIVTILFLLHYIFSMIISNTKP